MVWQRGTCNGKPAWVALDPAGKKLKTDDGKHVVRYEPVAGAALYNPSRFKLDADAAPEELPDGWPADSPEGVVVRFCLTDEAKRDWAFLDAWKRRRNTSLTHTGCGDQWPEVPLRAPLTCPRCGPLQGDDSVYAQWYTVKDPEGESVKVCVAEAWVTGKRHDYLAGRRPVPAKASTQKGTQAASPASTGQAVGGTNPAVLVLLGLVVVAAVVVGALALTP